MDLLLELGTVQLDHLRKVFLQNEGLDIQEFVSCMLELLPSRFVSQDVLVKTVSRLQDAFSQVDVNGDGNMSWEEMMAALIEAGSPQTTKALRNPFLFMEHEGFARNTRHSLRISRLRYIPELQLLAACEEGRRYVVLYDVAARKDVAEGYPRVCEIDTRVPGEAEGGDVFDIAYLPEQNVFLLATADFSMQFWDARPLAKHLIAPPPGRAAAPAPDADKRGGRKAGGDGRPASMHGYDEDKTKGAKARKPLPPMPDGVPALPSAPLYGKDADDAALADLQGHENAKRGVRATAAAPGGLLFIAKVHTPAPLRQICWVPGASKLLAVSTSADVAIWHVYMQKERGLWDMRVAMRGLLTMHQKQVTDMTFMRDLGLVATCSLDQSVALWAVRGLPDGMGGRRGFSDSPTHRPGHIASLPKGAAAAGIFLVTHHKGVHARGVRCLLYTPSTRMLFSAGYENFIQAWDMCVDDGTPTYKLLGHAEGVVGMTSLEPTTMAFEMKTSVGVVGASANANAELAMLKKRQAHYAQIVSVDESGEFRWWDCSRDISLADDDRCFQSWLPASSIVSNSVYAAKGLVTVRFPPQPKPPRQPVAPVITGEGPEADAEATALLEERVSNAAAMKDATRSSDINHGAVVLGVGSRVKAFEAVRQDDDRAVPAAGLYHDVSMSFMAVHQQDIRFFDATNGLLLAVHRGALPADAAPNCVTFDAGRRKLLVGCAGGVILVLNTYNCRPMKALPRHSVDISGVIYCDEDATVITSGWDGRLHVVDERITEMDGKRIGLLRRVKRSHGPSVPITTLAFDHSLSMIATAGSNGVIRLWDYQDLSFLGELVGHDAEITAMAFAPPWPVLVTSDFLGAVNVWHVSRGESLSCLASFAHAPFTAESPPPASVAEEGARYRAAALRVRMGTFFGMAGRRTLEAAAARSSSPGGGNGDLDATPGKVHRRRASTSSDSGKNSTTHTTAPVKNRLLQLLPVGGRPDLAQSVQLAVTSMCVIPPTEALASTLQTTVGVPVSSEEGGDAAVLGAGDVTPRVYPTLVLGDETGRLSYWDLGHVLGALALDLPEAPAPVPAGGLELGMERDGVGAVLRSTAAPLSPGAAPEGRILIPVRGPIEPVPEKRRPPNAHSYHPRKLVKRSGPRNVPRRVPVLSKVDAATMAAVLATTGLPVGHTKKRFGEPGSPIPHVVAAAALLPEVAPLPIPSSRSGRLAASKAVSPLRTLREDRDREEKGEEEDDGSVSVVSSEDEGEGEMDVGAMIGDSIDDAPVVPPAAAPAPASAPASRPPSSSVAVSAPFPSTFEGPAGEQVDDGGADGLGRLAASRRLPAVARVLGDAWKPTALVYAHGIFFDANMTDDPMAIGKGKGEKGKARVAAHSAVTGAKSGWKGFPVTSIALTRSVELTCVISTAADGTLRCFDLRGASLAALAVASGRRGAATPAPTGIAGKALMAASAQAVEWRLTLDMAIRDRVLMGHARSCLDSLDVIAKQQAATAEVLAGGARSSVELSEVKEYERRVRRSSIVAAGEYLEPELATRKAHQAALASVGDVMMGTDAKALGRARVIGQLFNATTFKAPGATAADAALEAAIKRQGRRGSVEGAIARVMGVNVLVMQQEENAARAADMMAPVPVGVPILVAPRAPDTAVGLAPSRPPSASRAHGSKNDREANATAGPLGRAALLFPSLPIGAEGATAVEKSLQADPSVRTLVELAQADVAEKKRAFFERKGKRPTLNTRAVTVSAEDGSKKGGDDGDDDEAEDADGDEDTKVVFDVGAKLAALTPAERSLRAVRASAARATTDTGGRMKINGVLVQDPIRAAASAAASAKEALLYPSFHNETHRPTTLEAALCKTAVKGSGKEDKEGEGYAVLSPFLRARLDELPPPERKTAGPRAASYVPAPASPAKAPSAAGQAPSPARTPGGGGKAAASLLRSMVDSPSSSRALLSAASAALDFAMAAADAPSAAASPGSRAALQTGISGANATLALLPPGSRLLALQSALGQVFSATLEHEYDGHYQEAPKHQTVAQLLAARNPELMASLGALRDRKRRGSILVSMSDSGVVAAAGRSVAAEAKAIAEEKGTKAAFVAQRQAALDVLAAKRAAGTAPAAAAPTKARGGASPRRGRRGRGRVPEPDEALTPEQFYLMSRRHRIGGQLSREVVNFAELVHSADTSRDGIISYDEFTAFIESGKSGMRHMKTHMESIFRAADKSGDGQLSIEELAVVMFPKAEGAGLREIVQFTSYTGPPPVTVASSAKRVFSADTVEMLTELFNLYDADGGGTIDRAELATAMTAMGMGGGGTVSGPGGPVSLDALEQAGAVMAGIEGGGEGDEGEIAYDEFVQLMGPYMES